MRPSPYLPAEEARGCAYCFDPGSPRLRTALMAPPPQETAPIPAAGLADDLVFFHRLLQQQYAGYPDLLQHRGFDPHEFFSRWVDGVRAAGGGAGGAIAFREGVIAPLAVLRRVIPDNHLTFRGADGPLQREGSLAFREYQAAHAWRRGVDGTAAEGLPGVRPSTLRRAPRLRADGRLDEVLTISAAGAAPALRLPTAGDAGGTSRAVALRCRPPTPAPAAPPDVPAYEWWDAGDTAVIALRRFSGPAPVRDQLSRLPDDYPQHAARRRVLFDLRGNGGGSLEYVDRWIAQACRGEWQSYPRLELAGALWPCSLWNVVVERQIREGVVDTAEAVAERERLRAAWPPRPPTLGMQLDSGVRRGAAAHPYAGRVFVLVDRHSGSSGELAAVQLKRALGATVIGERTGGTMQYGEARRFVLPRTGLVCQLPTKRFFFGPMDGEVESLGWPVDVYLEDIAQDATAISAHLDRLK